MKRPNPPAKIEHYKYDPKASKRPLAVRLLGWLSLLALAAAVYVRFFTPAIQLISNRLYVYVAFMVIFSAYVITTVIKRKTRCSKCQRLMEDINVQWTPEQWQEIQGYELIGSVTGADGNLYTFESEKKDGSRHYYIFSHLQHWCACHVCGLYSLKAQYWQKRIFTSNEEDEFEQAKQLVLTDPNASQKMEFAYKERLRGY